MHANIYRMATSPFPHRVPMGGVLISRTTKAYIHPPPPYDKTVISEIGWETYHMGHGADFLVSANFLRDEIWVTGANEAGANLKFAFDQDYQPPNKMLANLIRDSKFTYPTEASDGIVFADITLSPSEQIIVELPPSAQVTKDWFPLIYLLLKTNEILRQAISPYYWVTCPADFEIPSDIADISLQDT